MLYEVVTVSLDAKEKSGRIDMRVGAELKTIVVSRRALLSIASPPRATEVRLLQHIDTFCEIAADRLHSNEMDGTLRITANDVRKWRHAWQSSEGAELQTASQPLPA